MTILLRLFAFWAFIVWYRECAHRKARRVQYRHTYLTPRFRQAKNLPAKDDNGLSDPYLCFHYGDDTPEVRTETRCALRAYASRPEKV